MTFLSLGPALWKSLGDTNDSPQASTPQAFQTHTEDAQANPQFSICLFHQGTRWVEWGVLRVIGVGGEDRGGTYLQDRIEWSCWVGKAG